MLYVLNKASLSKCSRLAFTIDTALFLYVLQLMREYTVVHARVAY
jgi:hypothetical protein